MHMLHPHEALHRIVQAMGYDALIGLQRFNQTLFAGAIVADQYRQPAELQRAGISHRLEIGNP